MSHLIFTKPEKQVSCSPASPSNALDLKTIQKSLWTKRPQEKSSRSKVQDKKCSGRPSSVQSKPCLISPPHQHIQGDGGSLQAPTPDAPLSLPSGKNLTRALKGRIFPPCISLALHGRFGQPSPRCIHACPPIPMGRRPSQGRVGRYLR